MKSVQTLREGGGGLCSPGSVPRLSLSSLSIHPSLSQTPNSLPPRPIDGLSNSCPHLCSVVVEVEEKNQDWSSRSRFGVTDIAVPNGFGELAEPVRRMRRTC